MPLSVPGPANVPLSRHCSGAARVLRRCRDELEVEVWDGLQQFAEERPHALGREHVDLAAHVVAAALRPQRDGRVEIARADRLEVASRDRLGARLRDPFARAAGLAYVRRGLLDLGRCLCPVALLLSHASSSSQSASDPALGA